jgi:hypothetical protein
LDSAWWSTLETRDDPPVPHDYIVYAVDKNINELEPDVLTSGKIVPISGNFEERVVPRQVDLMWSHDSFQYALNPMQTLKVWKQTMNINGMLVLTVPQTTFIYNNRLTTVSHNHQIYSYNILNLMYMLASVGFDCRDAYFYREKNTPWLQAAVYATDITPGDAPSWYELADFGLVNPSVVDSLNKYGHARMEDLVVAWLDKDNHLITD